MQQRISGFPEKSRDIRDAARMMYRAAPGFTVVMWGLVVLLALVPSAFLLAQRRIVNHLEAALRPNGVEIWTFTIIAVVIGIVLLDTLNEFGVTLMIFVSDQIRDVLEISVTERLLQRTAEWQSLDLHENPDLLDKLRLASVGSQGFRQLAWDFFSFVLGVVGIIPLIILLGTIAWWMPIIVLMAIFPGIYMTMMIPRWEWREREKLAQQERLRDLYFQVSTLPDYARELRLFEMMPSRIAAWKQVALPVLTRVNNVRMDLLRSSAGFSLVAGALMLIPLIWLVNNTANGSVSLGDLVLVLGSLVALRREIWSITTTTSAMGSHLTGIKHYRTFVDIEPTALRGATIEAPYSPLTSTLTFESVKFAYPGAADPVLDAFSVTFRAGESVAIVGANGAGKTTLTRLISRLFDAQAGDIRWDDMSVYDRSSITLRRKLAVIPQDFARFPFSLRENIALGRVDNPPSDEEIERVLTEVGLGDLLMLNDHPLDTPLTKELDGGTQLSGGQWQRIAIARAMIRADQADIVVMDEPTASVDPLAEVDITRRMLHMAKGKTTIVISHRLGICTLVDRVLVMENGRIMEDGSHASLLAANGAYAEMFRAQAEWYAD